MARPTTKTDLLTAANVQFEKMWKLIDSLSEDQQSGTFANEMSTMGKEAHWSRDKNLRDVLVHLYEWHQLLLRWINSNANGPAKPFLPEPYNWKTYPVMNVGFWSKHQNTSLTDAKLTLKESHSEVVKLIKTFDNDELFAKKAFDWTGSSTLGAYCISATSSHYDWAIKKIKKHKSLQN